MSGSDGGTAAQPYPDPVSGREHAERLYDYLWRHGPTVPTTAQEDLGIPVGTFFNLAGDLEAEGLLSKPKDPRDPRRKVLIPHFGPHETAVEAWLAEVVYGDR